MSITVKRLREELATFPDDALCHAYEGEGTGIGIQDVNDDKSFGFIHCNYGPEIDAQTDRVGKFAEPAEPKPVTVKYDHSISLSADEFARAEFELSSPPILLAHHPDEMREATPAERKLFENMVGAVLGSIQVPIDGIPLRIEGEAKRTAESILNRWNSPRVGMISIDVDGETVNAPWEEGKAPPTAQEIEEIKQRIRRPPSVDYCAAKPLSSESERTCCPKCGAIPPAAARGRTLAFCATCDIAYSHEGIIVAAGLRSFPTMGEGASHGT